MKLLIEKDNINLDVSELCSELVQNAEFNEFFRQKNSVLNDVLDVVELIHKENKELKIELDKIKQQNNDNKLHVSSELNSNDTKYTYLQFVMIILLAANLMLTYYLQ